MTPQILKNTLVFLERVPVTGREAVAWCEAVAAIEAHLKTITSVPPQAPTE